MVLLRRLTAGLAMLAIVALLMLLAWDVYLHHKNLDGQDDSAVVALAARAS